jgi:nucleoside-diphosphate-sugar epimerase
MVACEKGRRMRLLVLGSRGQIGSHFLEYAESKNHLVMKFDILDGEEYDLRQPSKLLDKKVKWADIVLFLAFDVGGSQYLKTYEHSKKYIDNNVLIMKTVFDSLERFDTKFIFASSQMSNMVHSPYGILKRVGEFYTKALHGKNVRFWNVYGVESEVDKYHVITDFILMAREDRTIMIKSDGSEKRCFLHVEDCSRALLALCDKYDKLSEQAHKVYDISHHRWYTMLDVASIIADMYEGTRIYTLQDESKKEIGDTQLGIENIPDRYSMSLPGSAKPFWKPKIVLEEGIKMVDEEMRKYSHG